MTKQRRFPLPFDIGLLAAALLPLVAILPTFNGDWVINTADGVFHVHRIFAMTTLMQSGDLYPRWIPYFHLGYGYPVFNFYAPLATWLGGVLGVLGISAPLAFTLIVALGWMIGSAGVYALGRRWLPAPAALVGAALWAYAPSAFQGVWNIGSIAQMTASALVPWLFLAIIRLADQPSLRRVSALGVVFGLVLLAHQPTSVLVGLFVAPGAPLLCLWFARGDKRWLLRMVAVGGGLLLGAGIAMIFLLPMALELPYIQVSEGATNLRNVLNASFLQPYQLFLPTFAPDLSDLNRNLPDSIGLLTGVLAAVGLLVLVIRRQYRLALAWGAAALFVIFLLLPISLDFWLNVPLLGQLRFPGRVLRLGGVFFALLGASSLLWLPRRWQTAASAVALLVIIASSLPTLYPSRESLDFSQLSAADFIRYELDTYSFGGTSYDEFKPIWGEGTPYDAPDIDSYVTDPLRVDFITRDGEGDALTREGLLTYRYNAPQPQEVHFRQFYYPGWAAAIDGLPVEVFPNQEFGLLSVNVPAGEHVITLSRPGTPVENIAPLLTVVSLGIALLFAFRQQALVGEGLRPSRFPPLPTRFALAVMLGVVAFALVNRLYIQPQTDWFRLRSPLDTPAAMRTPIHAMFGDAYELLGYTFDQTGVNAGETLNVTLFWRALRPLKIPYPPTVQVVNTAVSEAWGTTGGFFIGAADIRHQPDYFVSETYKIPIYPDAPTDVGFISVQLRDSVTNEPLRLPDGSDRLLLPTQVQVTGSG
ncbi:MAG: hypothetical protein LCI00_29610 [Chloroflexi bacterium]|nr:hypothetical protein [Chloroflexota bacterium]MCC6893376.1 hypothetical protein [Anaerolineae bacterium]